MVNNHSATWREKCAPLIAAVIAQHGHDNPKKLQRALFTAYIFGPRKYWPYKVWCSEVRLQLGLAKHPQRRRLQLEVERLQGQGLLFPDQVEARP